MCLLPPLFFALGKACEKSGRVMRKDWIAVVGMLSVLDGYRAEIRRHYERCVLVSINKTFSGLISPCTIPRRAKHCSATISSRATTRSAANGV